jgi:hypothetical protein
MNQPTTRRRDTNSSRRRPRNDRHKPIDLWRPTAELPDFEPIEPVNDPTALLHSLGSAPQLGGTDLSHYLEAAARQSAQIARALAASVDALSQDQR